MPRIDHTFDVALADELARLESFNKHLFRPNTYLHKWWARRCGSTFRLILKHLVADPGRQEYLEPGGLEGALVVDPMLGGGTTIHEAIRLGASVAGRDLDPIPVLQAWASLSPVGYDAIEPAFNCLFEREKNALGPLFTTNCPICGRSGPLRFILYGLRQGCACRSVVAVDSLTVREEANGQRLRLCPRCWALLPGSDGHACQQDDPRPALVEKVEKSCQECGQRFQADLGRPFYRRYEPLAAVGRCPEHGEKFAAFSLIDRELLARADGRRPVWGDGAGFDVRPGPKSAALLGIGVGSYLDLFSSRQLIYLETAIETLPAVAPEAGLFLALLVSTSLDFNSMLSGYKGADAKRAGAIRHAFAHHGYAFPYTALENNPVYPWPSSGGLLRLAWRLQRGRRWATAPLERVPDAGRSRSVPLAPEVDGGAPAGDEPELRARPRGFLIEQGSASRLGLADGSADYIVTDPPYFDSVQYEDLSAFFRVWLRRLTPHPFQARLNWDYDLAGSAAAGGSGAGRQAYARFVETLTAIFREYRRVLDPAGGRLIFTYHHWRPEAWAALSQALGAAGFGLVNHYVVHSESPLSVHIAGLRALTHDAILVMAEREAEAVRPWPPVRAISALSSHGFVAGCAGLLGWCLQTRPNQSQIRAIWRAAIGGGGRPSAP